MSVEICIERLTASGVTQLDIADNVFDHEITPQVLQTYLADPRHVLIVAREGARIIGQTRGIIQLQPDAGPELYVDNLGVAPACQRTGIATNLTHELLQIARQEGCTGFWLATEPDNEGANAFYRSLGLASRTVTCFEGTT